MSMVEVNHIVKSYADKVAVSDVSFEVNRGEIFGLIGPNGAGKSTTIRIMMNIFQPDSGSVSILGKPLSEASKNDVGYLPEERGLYKKLSVIESIVYLASLKGIDKKSAIKRTDDEESLKDETDKAQYHLLESPYNLLYNCHERNCWRIALVLDGIKSICQVIAFCWYWYRR